MPRQPLPLDREELVEWGPDLDRLLLAVHDPIDRHSRLAVAQPLENRSLRAVDGLSSSATRSSVRILFQVSVLASCVETTKTSGCTSTSGP